MSPREKKFTMTSYALITQLPYAHFTWKLKGNIQECDVSNREKQNFANYSSLLIKNRCIKRNKGDFVKLFIKLPHFVL